MVATYGAPWAATMAGRSFLRVRLPHESLPVGLVVVSASVGVSPERWKPVLE